MSIVYVVIALVAMSGFISLGVDLGRVWLVRSELQGAADAAALAAATKLSRDPKVAASLAMTTAAYNFADGQPVVLRANLDVEFGKWDSDTRTFTLLTGPAAYTADAVRITAQRSQQRQDAIQLAFGPLLGMNQVDVQVSAIAATAFTGYGVIGLNYISMSGNATDSYWSSDGSYNAGSATPRGSIASNGDITLSGSSSVHGDARPGPGKQVFGANKVRGSTAPLTGTLSFPNGSAGSAASTNDNWRLPNGAMRASSFSLGKNEHVTVAGGVYYFNNFDMAGGSSLSFTSPATIYCYGSFSMSGNTSTNASMAKNLTVVMVPGPTGAAPGSMQIGSSAALYADIYAPQSAITLSGTGDIFGSVLGKSVTMSGTSAIHYDLSLRAKTGVSLVN